MYFCHLNFCNFGISVISISVLLKFLFLFFQKFNFCHLFIYVIWLSWLMVCTLTHIIGKDSRYRHGCIELNKDSWYRHGLMVSTWTFGIDMDSWYRHGLMVWTWTHGIEKDSGYIYRLMLLTTTTVLIESIHHMKQPVSVQSRFCCRKTILALLDQLPSFGQI